MSAALIVEGIDAMRHNLAAITKLLLEEGYANDTRLVQAIDGKLLELRKRWEKKL